MLKQTSFTVYLLQGLQQVPTFSISTTVFRDLRCSLKAEAFRRLMIGHELYKVTLMQFKNVQKRENAQKTSFFSVTNFFLFD